jgi:hypothetical protein
LNDHIRVIFPSSEPFSSRNVGNALQGMRNFRTEFEPVRHLMASVTEKIASCRNIFTVHEIVYALNGMKNMSSDYEETLALAGSLVPHVVNCRDDFPKHMIGSALHGFQNCSSDRIEVRKLLHTLVPKIQCFTGYLGSEELSNTLCGLQSMSAQHDEVRAVLGALLPCIPKKLDDITSHQIGGIIYGLNTLLSGPSSAHKEVRELVGVVSNLINLNNGAVLKSRITAKTINSALFAFLRLNSSYEEDMKLLCAFLPVIDLYVAMFQAGEGMNDVLKRDPQMTVRDAADLLRSIHLFRYYHREQHSDILEIVKTRFDALEILAMNFIHSGNEKVVLLRDNVSVCTNDELKKKGDGYKKENVSFTYVCNLLLKHSLPSNTYVVQKNTFLGGCFEADIVIHIKSPGHAESDASAQPLERIINLEIDGPSHNYPQRKKFSALRDTYIKEKLGVEVYRVDVQDFSDWNGERTIQDSLKLLNII